jgi:hypothetical protein
MDRVHVTWYIVHLLSTVKWEQNDMMYFLFEFRTLNTKYGYWTSENSATNKHSKNVTDQQCCNGNIKN